MLFRHLYAAAPTLAAAVAPSITNPFALLVALSGVGMAVAMMLAALSFKPPKAGQPSAPKPKISTADLTAEVRPRSERKRAASSAAARDAKAVV